MMFGRPDEVYDNPTRLIEEERLAGAFVNSMAHLRTTGEFGPVLKTAGPERRLVAARTTTLLRASSANRTASSAFSR